jgi:hypothetical protein
MSEKIRWFVYEVELSDHEGIIDRLKKSENFEKPQAALNTIYMEETEVYEGHDVASGKAYYVFKSWECLFFVLTSRVKVKGEKRAFECWA